MVSIRNTELILTIVVLFTGRAYLFIIIHIVHSS